MTRRAVSLWAATATFSLAIGPALAAQSKERPAGGSTTGSAVARPSGGGSSGGSSSGGSSGGGSAGSSSSSGGSASSMPSGGGSRDRSDGGVAPSAPERRASDRAVSRGRTSGTAASAGDSSGDSRRAVPAYSRPRDGRTPVGTAAERQTPPVRGGNGNVIFYPYYDPFYGYGYGYGSRYGYSGYYGPWFAGYGFGLGYFYDPFGYNYYSPYDAGYGYGQYSYGRSRYERYGRTGPVGQLRLKVKPSEGQVYVDGYYVGDVDSFDGLLQRLAIEAGAHRIEIRAAGYETVSFDVMIAPGETVTYKGELKRIR